MDGSLRQDLVVDVGGGRGSGVGKPALIFRRSSVVSCVSHVDGWRRPDGTLVQTAAPKLQPRPQATGSSPRFKLHTTQPQLQAPVQSPFPLLQPVTSLLLRLLLLLSSACLISCFSPSLSA